jgi:REP element-mobilizing transposase RayT
MGRRLRYIPPEGCLVEVTNRTIQGRFLLRPGRELNKVVVGVLGRAQRLYGVEIHAFVVMSNHFHLLLSVESALQLARFMAYFQGNLAKEAGRLHRWHGPFWHRRYQHVVVSDEERAQVGRLRYILENGCKEELVASPLDWPGVSSVRALLYGTELRGEWIDRTRQRHASVGGGEEGASRFREREVVNLTPLPCWRGRESNLLRQQLQELVAIIEAEAEARHRAKGTRPLGEKQVLLQDPLEKPLRSKRSKAPLFHCASKAAHDLLKGAYAAFDRAFREAARKWQRGDLETTFPEGAFPPPLPFQNLSQVTG